MTTTLAPTNTPLKAIGWVPELHLVPCQNYRFDLILDNGDIRTFAIFAQDIEAYPLLIVHFDPNLEDEVSVFGSLESKKGFHSKSTYLGTALPLRTKLTGRPELVIHRQLHQLDPRKWYDVANLADQMPCYLRDASGRMAFGYKDAEVKGGYAIISGPHYFQPAEFQCAEPIDTSLELVRQLAPSAQADRSFTLN